MICTLFGYAFSLYLLPDHYHWVKLGDTAVIIQQQANGAGKAFVHLHQNETTALAAAQAVVHAEGGSVLTLVHAGGRNIVFHVNNEPYEFDPNRMFTEAGIQKTLAQFGEVTPEAVREVARLADKIKTLLPKGKTIAVHNNEDYSLNDYLPGHSLAADARLLHVNEQHFYRNFYLVTQTKDYQRLSQLQFNSILQAEKATDDGSLSVFLADRDYINVEAGYDQLAVQIKMLRWA